LLIASVHHHKRCPIERRGVLGANLPLRLFDSIDELDYGDHRIKLEQGGEKIAVRVLKFRLKGGEDETLITDIEDKKLGIKAFKALYFKRWPIETKYNQIKIISLYHTQIY